MVTMNDDQRAHDEVLTGAGGADRMPQSDSPIPAGSASAGSAGAGSNAEAAAAQDEAIADSEDKAEDEPEEKSRSRFSFLTEMVVLFAVALTIALLIKTFVVQPFYIPSGSMMNTLLVGDKVLVNNLVYHVRPIARGDVIVFDGAGSWDPPTANQPTTSNPVKRIYDDTLGALFHSIAGLFGTAPGQTDYIKRVIGIPGDHVMCCNSKGEIKVNGVALSEKSFVFPGEKPSQEPFKIIVPPGRLWVMGDHREESADSRLHDCNYSDPEVTCVSYDRNGTIPENKVIGRAFMIVWPPSRFRILPIPSTFEQPKLVKADGGRASPAALAPAVVAQSGGLPIKPRAPYLPLGIGLAGAVPLTVAERWLRQRLRARRRNRSVSRPQQG
jgi:signal peptidase I